MPTSSAEALERLEVVQNIKRELEQLCMLLRSVACPSVTMMIAIALMEAELQIARSSPVIGAAAK